jgi:hypothetical protein
MENLEYIRIAKKGSSGKAMAAANMNELFQHVKRRNGSMLITAIDFTNAFGSVPHDLIMKTMKQRNFPEWTQKIVRDLYDGASSIIQLKGEKSSEIPRRKGGMSVESSVVQLVHRATDSTDRSSK